MGFFNNQICAGRVVQVVRGDISSPQCKHSIMSLTITNLFLSLSEQPAGLCVMHFLFLFVSVH